MSKVFLKLILSFTVNFLIFIAIFWITPIITSFKFNIGIARLIYSSGLFSFAYSSIYFINDYSDMEEDKIDKPYNLANSFSNLRIHWGVYLFILTLTSILFLLEGMVLPIIGVLLINVYQAIYSLPPTRLKDRIYLFIPAFALFYPAKITLIYLMLGIINFNQLIGILVVIFFLISLATIYYKGIYKKKSRRKIPLLVIVLSVIGTIVSITLVKPNYLIFLTVAGLILVGRSLVAITHLIIRKREL